MAARKVTKISQIVQNISFSSKVAHLSPSFIYNEALQLGASLTPPNRVFVGTAMFFPFRYKMSERVNQEKQWP
jgi:hypothetical protein